MRILFLLFIIIPIVEIMLLIQVGEAIGTWYTVGLVLLSAFIGVNMLRYQGVSTLMRARARMSSGELPAQEMIEGIILAVGGALLVTPGFVTDFFGFCCLLPFVRQGLVGQLRKHFSVVSMQPNFTAGNGPVSGGESGDPVGPRRPNAGRTFDGDYQRED